MLVRNHESGFYSLIRVNCGKTAGGDVPLGRFPQKFIWRIRISRRLEETRRGVLVETFLCVLAVKKTQKNLLRLYLANTPAKLALFSSTRRLLLAKPFRIVPGIADLLRRPSSNQFRKMGEITHETIKGMSFVTEAPPRISHPPKLGDGGFTHHLTSLGPIYSYVPRHHQLPCVCQR